MTVASDEDVLGLEVAVHDTGAVGGLEGLGDLDGELECLFEGKRATGDRFS